MAGPVSPARRAAAARELRRGGSNVEAARAARVKPRTICRWKTEPDFQNLLHSRGVMVAGPLKIVADDSQALNEVATDETILWLDPHADVIGSLVVADATHMRVVFVPADDVQSVRDDLSAQRFPSIQDAHSVPLVASALADLQDPAERTILTTICTAPEAEAFRAFLSLWRYRSQELKEVRVLGEDLWPAQEQLIDSILSEPHLMILKARKLGLSTVCIAYAGYCLRFRDRNARVHLFSRAEKAALELFAAVRFGLDNLPTWMRLPKERETLKEMTYNAGPDDERVLVAYPTGDAVAVEAQASHSMCDEAADIPRWDTVFSSLEPTMTSPGATSHIVFTGGGPANPTTAHYKRAESGDTTHAALFIDALQRPDRDAEWLERKRKTMLQSQWQSEYPMSAQEALAGSGEFTFDSRSVERSDYLSRPPRGMSFYCPRHPITWRTDPRSGERCPRCPMHHGPQPIPTPHVIAWDIGGPGANADASAGTVLDCAGEVLEVVEQRRFVGLSFPMLQREIEQLAADFPNAPVAIEMSGIGAAVRGNLNIPDYLIVEFWTTARSKARIVGAVARELQSETLKFSHEHFPQLATELRGYQDDDTYCVTDCVMSLAIAIDCAAEAHKNGPGRVLTVIEC
jgi:hypothetical protein